MYLSHLPVLQWPTPTEYDSTRTMKPDADTLRGKCVLWLKYRGAIYTYTMVHYSLFELHGNFCQKTKSG